MKIAVKVIEFHRPTVVSTNSIYSDHQVGFVVYLTRLRNLSLKFDKSKITPAIVYSYSAPQTTFQENKKVNLPLTYSITYIHYIIITNAICTGNTNHSYIYYDTFITNKTTCSNMFLLRILIQL